MQRSVSTMSNNPQQQASNPRERPAVPLTVLLVLVLAAWAPALLRSGAPTLLWSGAPTFRGQFDRIRVGMTKSEVHAVMGRPGNDQAAHPYTATYAVRRTAEDCYERKAPEWKVYLMDPGQPNPSRGLERWESDNTAVCDEYDACGRVSEVLWLEVLPRPKGFLERVRAWLPF
jgi:hypothetical protein